MPTSTDGNRAGVNSPSSANAAPPSVVIVPHYSRQLKKLFVADQARLMADNQRVLDMVRTSNQVYREQGLRLREAQLSKLTGQPAQAIPPLAEADPVASINIDSPTVTHNHNYPPLPPPGSPVPPPAAVPAPTAPAAGLSTLAKAALIGAGILGAGGLGVAATAALLKPAAAVAPATAPATAPQGDFRLQVVPDKGAP